MKKTRYLFIIFFFVFQYCIQGQIVADSTSISLGYPVYSQYLHNGLVINPAYAGTRGVLSTSLSYRKYWIGMTNAPVLESISLHSPMKNDKVAIGLNAEFMQFGRTKSTNVYASYAYHLKLKNGKLSLGLKAGVDMSNTNYKNLLLDNSDDPVFLTNDKPYILPNTGAGVYYFSDKFFAGLSVPHFINYRLTDSGTTQAYHNFSDYDFIFSTGGLITFSPMFKFKPSLLINYSLKETKKISQFDISGNLIIADLLWVGGSWRTSEEVAVGIIQVQVNSQLMIGCSYDYPVGRMNTYSKGSGEFFIRYEFGYKVSAANPRYF